MKNLISHANVFVVECVPLIINAAFRPTREQTSALTRV
jgi:hypothetical protein